MISEEMPVDSIEKKNMNRLYVPAAIVVAGAIIGGGIFFGLSGKTGGTPQGGPQPQPQPQAVNIKDVNIAGAPYVGNAKAPLTMAYWYDYQCPFCKQFEETVLPTLMQKYVNTGKLKIVFKDFAFLGKDSITGALYKHAVWELYPDKFFAWNQAMFKAQDAEGDQGFGDEASILKLSATIPGIDANKLKSQVAAKKAAYEKAVTADQQEGAKFGIQGTPGFIVGKQSIDGAQPLANFISVIDSQLK